MASTCDLPPKKPAAVVRSGRTAKQSAPASVSTANTSCSTQNVQVRIDVKPVEAKTLPMRIPRPQAAPVYTVKPKRPFSLGVLLGSTPTQHEVGETQCDFARNQCKVDIERKRVVDFGFLGSYSFSSGLQLGVLGTAQGNVYGIIGFNF